MNLECGSSSLSEVDVLDGLFDDGLIEFVYRQCRGGAYACVESDLAGRGMRNLSWVSEDVDPGVCSLILRAAEQSARYGARVRRFTPYRRYVNAFKHGDAPLRHRDTGDSSDVTVLYYANDVWDPDWGGETMFYDGAGEVTMAVVPRPGRIVVFHGDLIHSARAPRVLFSHYRYSIAIKLAAHDSAIHR